MFVVGGGVRGGMMYGATDRFGMKSVEDRVHVHDLHATILHLPGIDRERLTTDTRDATSAWPMSTGK